MLISRNALSTFRDGRYRTWGFELFGLLTFIGLNWIWTLIRTRSFSELVGVVLAFPLLGFVALTDFMDGWHLAASFVLLGWMLLFFTAKLWEEENWLVFVHLLMLIAIGLRIQFHSFGLWQKSLIAYFVVLINMHDLLRLCEHETKPLPRPSRIPVSELTRQFYESGHFNPLQRQSDDELSSPNSDPNRLHSVDSVRLRLAVNISEMAQQTMLIPAIPKHVVMEMTINGCL